jgi:small subunit ribosomal protein S6
MKTSAYEIAVLYHPDLEIDLEKAEAKFTKIVESNNGKIKKVDNWGKRKLAYKIANHEHAVYVFYEVEIEPTSVAKIESTLNITDEVIRFLIVKPDVKAIAKAELVKAKRKNRDENDDRTSDEDSEK